MGWLERDTERALVGVVLFGALVAAPAFILFTPAFEIDTTSQPAIVHLQTLGEYPSGMRSIEIVRDGDARPLWKIVADGDMFQLHAVSLDVGDNPVTPSLSWGRANPVAPQADTFRLEPEVNYRITVCPSGWPVVCRSRVFALPAD